MIKYCCKCIRRFEVSLQDAPSLKHCSSCGENLRGVLIEELGERFLELLPGDGPLYRVDGIHLGCGGFVSAHSTSIVGRLVYACQACYCRIYQNEGDNNGQKTTI